MRGEVDDKTGMCLFRQYIGSIIEVEYASSNNTQNKRVAVGFLKGIEIIGDEDFRIMIEDGSDGGTDVYSNWIVKWRPYTANDWREPRK